MTTDDLVATVDAALEALAAEDQAVTFTGVAQRAGVARATLYRNATLRALVDQRRHDQIDTHTLTGLHTEIAHLRTALEALADRVRDHEERLRHLERRRSTRAS